MYSFHSHFLHNIDEFVHIYQILEIAPVSGAYLCVILKLTLYFFTFFLKAFNQAFKGVYACCINCRYTSHS